MHCRIATRSSPLALWQAEHIASSLRQLDTTLETTLVPLRTTGDRILDRPLAEIGGKGLFIKEVEEALLEGRADLAVHSLKDLPATLAPGLILAAVPAREDARDALIVAAGLSAGNLASLPPGARVGTSSPRRICQLKSQRADLVIEPLRGNVDTRLRRLDEGRCDALVLAVAGLKRLGLQQRITHILEPAEMLPAIGQGALAVEVRQDDRDLRKLLERLDDWATATVVTAERAFLARLGGDCHTPMAAHGFIEGAQLNLEGLVGSLSGTPILRARLAGPTTQAASLGRALADWLIERGALHI